MHARHSKPRRDLLPRLFVLGLAVGSLASCRRDSIASERVAASPDASVELSLEVLRESARETLDSNCGECHTSGLPTALPRALRIFDLGETDWSTRMTPAQLREAERRLREPTGPTRAEGEIRPLRVSPEELARFHAFVEREVDRRAGGKP